MTSTATDSRSLIPEATFLDVAAHIRQKVVEADYAADLHGRVIGHLSGKGRLLPEGRYAPWPFLTLLCFSTFPGVCVSAAVPAAASVELMVACADLLDDVQDGEGPDIEGRRDAGRVMEVLCVLLFLCHQAMLSCMDRGISADRVTNALARLDGMALRALGGQHLDVADEQASSLSLSGSLEVSSRKSASLTRCAAEVAAALGTDDESVISLYGQFGQHLGLMGQLMNDIAAVWPGGPRKSDLRLRKKTLPIVAGLEAAARGDPRASVIGSFMESTSAADRGATPDAEDAVKWALWECGAIRKVWLAAAVERTAAAHAIRELEHRVPSAACLSKLIA